jgi:CMP-N,N'-diacetyllegionaminic acid synthase
LINVTAIIPARGGSKGVPNKNKKVIGGKPLIAYTIEAALNSNFLGKIVVSSDDPEIIDIAKQYKGVAVHQREESMASDTSPVGETVYAIIAGDDIDAVMILQPTAPIRTGKNIDEAIQKLNDHDTVNSVISVVEMNDIHPARMYWNRDFALVPIMPEFEKSRRQDIPTAYYRNGSIYLTRKKAFMADQSFITKPIMPYIMPFNWLLNIDEPRDILIAESLIPAWIKKMI